MISILSPLEQFNILSICDFSFASLQFASFETVYANFLFFVWHLFFNCPFGVLQAIYTVVVNDLPLFSIIAHSFGAFCTLALGIFLPFVRIFTNIFSDLFVSISAYAPIFNFSDILLSIQFPLWSFFSQFPSTSFSLTQTSYADCAANLSFISKANSGFGVTLYFLFMEIGLFCWSFFYQTTLENLLNLSTKDVSYLIFSLNTSTIWLTIGFVFLTFLFISVTSSIALISKNTWQTLLQLFYGLILGIVNDSAGPKGRKYFPLIFTTFMIILICNVQGMIPYSFTVTSHLIVTFSLALAIFIGINILGILKNGKHFLALFFPPGAPLALAPLLVLIELVSYVFRVLSLAIRLFANLMSGHTLLKILSAYAWLAVNAWGLFLIPLVIIFLVTGLELAIAFLQAYIFSVLLCIYINDAFNLH